MIMVLPGCGQRCEGPPVKAVLQRHDRIVLRSLLLCGILAGRLDGSFVCLGTRVAEEDLLHPAPLAQHFGKHCAGLGIVQVRHVLQLSQLLCHGGDPGIIRDAEGRHADAAAHVDVFLPRLVPDQRAFSRYRLNRKPGIGIGNIFLIDCFQFRHRSFPFYYSGSAVTMVPAPSSVRISIRIECGTRPSMMITRSTPR